MIALILFIVFLVLKLVGVIAWSWLWVTSPLWIAAVIVGVLVLLAVFVNAAILGAVAKALLNK